MRPGDVGTADRGVLRGHSPPRRYRSGRLVGDAGRRRGSGGRWAHWFGRRPSATAGGEAVFEEREREGQPVAAGAMRPCGGQAGGRQARHAGRAPGPESVSLSSPTAARCWRTRRSSRLVMSTEAVKRAAVRRARVDPFYCVDERAMGLGDNAGLGVAEVEHSVGARRPQAPAAAGGLEISHADPGVPVKDPAHVGRRVPAIALASPRSITSSRRRAAPRRRARSQLAGAQQVERALAGEVAVAAVQPDLDALGLVDVAQALDEVCSSSRWSRCSPCGRLRPAAQFWTWRAWTPAIQASSSVVTADWRRSSTMRE